MSQSINLADRFTLDEEKAREWLDRIVAIHDSDELPESSQDPEFGATWEPAACGEESTVDMLVYAAANSGVIAKPAGTDLYFSYMDQEDGGNYCFLVDVGHDWAKQIRLASMSTEMRKLVHYDTTGVDAALSILREAVATANHQLGLLSAFVATQVPADEPQNVCDECGAPIPGELISAAHSEACSGHPRNIT